MEITPLTGNIGAEVKKLQLADLNDDKFADVAQALWAHQVLVFRDQQMNVEDLSLIHI